MVLSVAQKCGEAEEPCCWLVLADLRGIEAEARRLRELMGEGLAVRPPCPWSLNGFPQFCAILQRRQVVDSSP
jgi:hypothetical protein